MAENPRGNRSVAAQVDENLRRIFDEDVEAELPDRLLRLAERLDAGPIGPEDDDGSDDEGGGTAGGDGGGAGIGGSGTHGPDQGAAAQAAAAAMPAAAAGLRIASEISRKDAR